MTEEEELQQAVDAAETEVQALEVEVSTFGERRLERSREALAPLKAKHQALTRGLEAVKDEERVLRIELTKLRRQLKKPGFQLPTPMGTWASLYLRSAAFVVYTISVLAMSRVLESPGLILSLLVALPAAYLLLMVAGSLRESGIADTIGERAREGQAPARLPPVDERPIAAPSGPGHDGTADLPGGRVGEADRRRE